jgi:hypothetical protein
MKIKDKVGYSGFVDAVGIIAAFVVVGVWCRWGVKFIPATLFALLALLPGAIAIIYYFVSALPRYLTHHEGVTDYILFCQSYDRWWQQTGWPRKLAALGLKPQRDVMPAVKNPSSTAPTVDRPYFAATLWAALLLTFVFMIAVSVADYSSTLYGKFPQLDGQEVTMSPSSTKAAAQQKTGEAKTDAAKIEAAKTEAVKTEAAKIDAAKTQVAKIDAAKTEPEKIEAAKIEGAKAEAAKTETAKLETARNDGLVIEAKAMNGLIFAALGAFVSVMWRMIKRINANALTSRFLFTAALRSAIAMMVGLTAGQFDLFGFLNPNGPRETVLFLTGLFTDWALDALRNRASTVFVPAASQTADQLPLNMVDGLDDGVIDILDEIGIWDIEHLATCEPGELTLRTLYPFNRVADWIDQAVLINYIRRNIPAARDLGIRGAIDLMLLYSYIVEGNKPGTIDGSASCGEADAKAPEPPPAVPPPTQEKPLAAAPVPEPAAADAKPPMGQADAARASQQLVAPAPTNTSYAARAWRTLDELATRSKISRDALEIICVNLWLDYTVEQLYRFRQHSAQREPNGSTTAAA